MRRAFIRALAAVLVAGAFSPVRAPAASTVQIDHVALDAAVEHAAVPGSTVWVAIRQTIAPGWHTYWRNPGDSGLATSIFWILPKGILPGPIRWPTPEMFTTGPIVNYGYRNKATLLIPLNVTHDATIAPARAKLFLLECAQMCIPESATLDIDLRAFSNSGAVFAKARAAFPHAFDGSAKIAVSEKSVTLTLSGPQLAGLDPKAASFYPATVRVVDYDSPPAVRIVGDTLTWTAMRSRRAKPFGTFEGVLDVAGVGSFAVTATRVPATPFAVPNDEPLTLAAAALMAFLGGLLLNLMPCVLPILSMKALALARSAGDTRQLRRDGALYFLGVLSTFAAIGGSLLLLKAGGAALGWGFQLQSPQFVFLLALLTAAIGLNLLGVFELPLAWTGVGENLTRTKGGQGAFFTGALAVAVASPCTAPFMGAATGYALAQPFVSGAAVFLALGTGFALPFTALAFTPFLVRTIPKPGAWMVRFKEFLAFPMFATAIWLIWVLDRQVGSTGLATAFAIGLGLVFLLWLVSRCGERLRWAAVTAGCAALIALSSTIHSLPVSTDRSWAPWSEEAVADARRLGKPVLVDFSADWCVTCLVNERTALEDETVATRLKRDGVITLKGDWTNRDGAIAAELNRYGRGGVPLYLYYPAGRENRAIVLPQILTSGLILSALGEKKAN